VTDRASVDLSGAAQTMLTTLYLKALDADFDRPVLADRYAKDAISRLDYDWREIGITGRWAPLVTVRTAQYDIWASQFLAVHQHSTVVHLGCGLDSRVFRLDPGPGVDWYDVDYPDVTRLREQLYPARDHHHVVAASVTDPGWLTAVPQDRPSLMIGEGLTMYLTEQDGLALLRRVVEHFPSGELQFDAFNWLGIKSQWANAVVRRSGSKLYWAINGPEDIIGAVPGTRLLAWVPVFESDAFAVLPGIYAAMAAVMKRVPGLRTMAQFHRYAF
jgi:O-methyltransferase involved in polyketide biosynthesis